MRHSRAETIDADSCVQAVARQIGCVGNTGLETQIVKFARAKVAGWLDTFRIEPASLDELHRFVLNQTGVKVVRLEEEEDLHRVSNEYARKMPALPVQLEFEFAGDTEAVVFRRQDATECSASRYVAVVDARGQRKASAWFSERHEPAHVLIPDRSNATAWRRTRSERPEPIEQVVDAVAAEVGFWDPLVRPHIALATGRLPVIDAFRAAHEVVAPAASIEASNRAFIKYISHPCVMLRVNWGPKRNDLTGESFALRVQSVLWNEAADRVGLRLPKNYRIPPHSVIVEAESDPDSPLLEEVDDMARWSDSTGRRLESRLVRVTARGSWAAIEDLG